MREAKAFILSWLEQGSGHWHPGSDSEAGRREEASWWEKGRLQVSPSGRLLAWGSCSGQGVVRHLR